MVNSNDAQTWKKYQFLNNQLTYLHGLISLADAKAFTLKEGLSWKSGDRTRTETDLLAWVGKRAQAGRLAPKGFPRSNNFG